MIEYSLYPLKVGDSRLITWTENTEKDFIRYELQLYIDDEWIILNSHLAKNMYVFSYDEPIRGAKFRYRCIYRDNGIILEDDWIEGESFDILAKKDLEGTINILANNKMNFSYKVIGVGDKSLSGSIGIIIDTFKDLDGTIRMSRYFENLNIASKIVVGLERDKYLPINIGLRPTNKMRFSYDVLEAELHTHEIPFIEDTFIREDVTHVNYGHNAEFITGSNDEDLNTRTLALLRAPLERLKDEETKDIMNVYIKLTRNKDIREGNTTLELYQIDDVWGEDWTTWYNRPELGDLIKQGQIDLSDRVLVIDVKDHYYELLNSGHTHMDIGLKADNIMTFIAKEFGNDEVVPKLCIDYYDNLIQGAKDGLDGEMIILPNKQKSLRGSIDVKTEYKETSVSGRIYLKPERTKTSLDGSIDIIFADLSYMNGKIDLMEHHKEHSVNGELELLALKHKNIDGSISLTTREDSNHIPGVISTSITSTDSLSGLIDLKENNKIIDGPDGHIEILLYNDKDMDGLINIMKFDKESSLDLTFFYRNDLTKQLDGKISILRDSIKSHLDGRFFYKNELETSIDGSIELNKINKDLSIPGGINLKNMEDETSITGSIIPMIAWATEGIDGVISIRNYNKTSMLNGTIEVDFNYQKIKLDGTIELNEINDNSDISGTITINLNQGYVYIL